MAFTSAGGYGNLPNGNFSSVIYSKKVQLAFRKSTVVGDITNSDYFGEISAQGDTVRIIKEPEISVSSYARGTQITAQDLDDEDFSLVVDKSNYFAFKGDGIEEAHRHVNFMQLATDRAAYRLADQHDQEVLGYLSGWKQATLHANANTVNDVVNGTKAIDGASDGANLVGAELLSTMSLDASDFTDQLSSAVSGNVIPMAPRLPGATDAVGAARLQVQGQAGAGAQRRVVAAAARRRAPRTAALAARHGADLCADLLSASCVHLSGPERLPAGAGVFRAGRRTAPAGTRSCNPAQTELLAHLAGGHSDGHSAGDPDHEPDRAGAGRRHHHAPIPPPLERCAGLERSAIAVDS